MRSIDATEISCTCADNIIDKPFNIDVVIDMIHDLLPKPEENTHSEDRCISYKELSVNVASYSITVDGIDIKLPPKEIELLYLLLTRIGQVISRGELASLVWGRILPDTRTLSVHINRIKSKLGPYSDNIVSVRGMGYVFRDY